MDVDETPTDVFERVAHETRLDILRALVRAHSESPDDPWVEYSDLREAVGARDKGNFNYHLDRLDGLIRKEERGYLIGRVGIDLVAAVASGSLDSEWSWGPVDVPGDCLYCDRSLTLRYEGGALRLSCGVDDHRLFLSAAPSLFTGVSERRALERVAAVLYHQIALARRGICWECQGRVEGELRRWAGEYHFYYHGDCQRCGYQHGFPAGAAVLAHPAVLDFFHERGVDVRSTPYWTFEFCNADHETVLSTDPLRLRVDVERDGDRLSITMDREGTVVDVERGG